MFRLKATLVATSLMRPWRTGWSMERGVDFSLVAVARPATAPPATREDRSAAEPACFIDEDRVAPPSAGLVAGPVAIEPPCEDSPDTAGMRAWWSLSGKPPRT